MSDHEQATIAPPETAPPAPEPPAPQPAAPAPTPLDEARRLFQMAAQLQNGGDHDGAYRNYLQALEILPGLPDAYNNIAVMLKAAKKLPAAVACLRRAATLAPNSGSVHSNLGNLLWMSLDYEAAEMAFRRSLELDPDRPETLHNYGLLRFSLGNYAGALECYDRVLQQRPDNTLVRWDRALSRLVSGDLARGFAEYDVRFDLNDPTMRFDPKLRTIRDYPMPMWQGEDLAGKTIYVYFEQGLGDSLQFVRYLPLLAQRGARIIFDCQPELIRVMQTVAGITELRAAGAPLPTADYHIPLLSLPSRFGTTLETVPAQVPYIAPPVAGPPPLFRPAGTRLAVGIVWAGRPEHANDHNRSLGLENFLGLCDLPGVVLYSLQKGPRANDIAALTAQAVVRDLSPNIRDFADTAALISQLDLVIGVDTSVVHLSGALGRPTFVLLPFTPDWRWLHGRETSPWYPTMRLYRQPAPLDWKSVMRRVHDVLATHLGVAPTHQA